MAEPRKPATAKAEDAGPDPAAEKCGFCGGPAGECSAYVRPCCGACSHEIRIEPVLSPPSWP